MGSMSIVHWMIVIGIVVLLFGRNKISDLMGDVASGIKSFKKGLQDDEPDGPKSDDSKPAQIAMDHPVSPPVAQPTNP